MTFISNLFSILWNIPSAIGIIKAIMDIVGSDTVQKILELIRRAVQAEPNTMPTSEAGRQRLFQRRNNRIALQLLGLPEERLGDLEEFCDACNHTGIG